MWEGGSCHLGVCVRDLAFAGEQFSPSSYYFSLAAFTPRPVVPGAARAWVSRGFIGVTWVVAQFVYCWVRIQFSWICSVITFISVSKIILLLSPCCVVYPSGCFVWRFFSWEEGVLNSKGGSKIQCTCWTCHLTPELLETFSEFPCPFLAEPSSFTSPMEYSYLLKHCPSWSLTHSQT